MPRTKQRNYIHYIYKINFLCGKSGRYYLGKRSYYGLDINNDKYTGSGNFCIQYFSKYGKIEGKTYTKEILEVNENQKINKDREKIIIGDLWKTDPLCMNQKHGGDGGAIEGHIVKEETRKKIGDFHRGNKYSLGRKHTKEAKEKDRIAHLGNKYGLGHKMTEENKKKLLEINQKKVCQFDLDGNLIAEFESINKASEITGASKIVSCCTKQRLTSGGYIWRYKNEPISSEELEKIKTDTKFKSCNKRAVYRIDKDGSKTWYESVRDAARQNKIHNSSIHAVCSGERCTAGGYKWNFVED